MVEIIISNKIYLKNVPPEMTRDIKAGLTIPNLLHEQMARRAKFSKDKESSSKFRRALFGIAPDFKYYEEKGDVLIIDRGNEDKLWRYVRANKDNKEIEVGRVQRSTVSVMVVPNPLQESIKLRDYQEGIPEQILLHNQGIAELSTGFGKTIIAMKLIEITQAPTLIICHQDKEVEKYISDFKKFYNYTPGRIQGAKTTIDYVTIGSISTLCRRDLSSISDKFGMIIVDECQLYASNARRKVIQSFYPDRLYGLTGTNDRSDGQGKAIGFLFGDTLVKAELPQAAPIVHVIKSNVEIKVDDYADMIDEMINDVGRNELIWQLMIDEACEGRKVLVLTKRTEHYKKLFEMLDHKNYRCHCIESGLGASEKKEQIELLDRLGNGSTDFDIIFGTYSMLAVGANLPALDTLILAGDIRSKVLSRQAVGRILRLFKNKRHPKVIDIDDNLNPILHSQARSRRSLYKENKWEIK